MPITKPSKQDFPMMKSTQTQNLDTTLKQCNKQLQNLSIIKPFQLQDLYIKSKQNNQFAISSLQNSSSKLSSFKQCIIPQFQQCYTPQFKQNLYIPQSINQFNSSQEQQNVIHQLQHIVSQQYFIISQQQLTLTRQQEIFSKILFEQQLNLIKSNDFKLNKIRHELFKKKLSAKNQ